MSLNSSEDSRRSGDTWFCSCGQKNVGDFCVACGKPKSQVESSTTKILKVDVGHLNRLNHHFRKRNRNLSRNRNLRRLFPLLQTNRIRASLSARLRECFCWQAAFFLRGNIFKRATTKLLQTTTLPPSPKIICRTTRQSSETIPS